MAIALADMIDVYVLSEAEMEGALLIAGNRGNILGVKAA